MSRAFGEVKIRSGASTMQQWGIAVEPKEQVFIKEPKTSSELV